jgi:hypothetical protein
MRRCTQGKVYLVWQCGSTFVLSKHHSPAEAPMLGGLTFDVLLLGKMQPQQLEVPACWASNWLPPHACFDAHLQPLHYPVLCAIRVCCCPAYVSSTVPGTAPLESSSTCRMTPLLALFLMSSSRASSPWGQVATNCCNHLASYFLQQLQQQDRRESGACTCCWVYCCCGLATNSSAAPS